MKASKFTDEPESAHPEARRGRHVGFRDLSQGQDLTVDLLLVDCRGPKKKPGRLFSRRTKYGGLLPDEVRRLKQREE